MLEKFLKLNMSVPKHYLSTFPHLNLLKIPPPQVHLEGMFDIKPEIPLA